MVRGDGPAEEDRRRGEDGPGESREAAAMNASNRPTWFVGDLDDPWVAAIAHELPVGAARVAVVSGNHELRLTLADACRAAGFPVRTAVDCASGPTGPLCVWDVPVLDPEWTGALARRSRLGMVVALLGFADRALVREARAR